MNNILVIMTDQQSKNVLGCYGNTVVRTPNIDRLATQGVRFTSAYCSSPLCVPSRMSFLTSMFPSGNRVWNNEHILDSSIPTWAHALCLAGYDTALIGRMHFEGPDQRHGFIKRPIGEYWSNHPGAPTLGGPAWTKFPESTAGQNRLSVEIAGRGQTSYQWLDEQVAQTACRFIKERAAGRSDQPFAAVVGFVLPHCPFIAPRELFDFYYDRVDIPEIGDYQPRTIQRFLQFRGILEPPLDQNRVRIARTAYFALCEHSDSLVGRILAALDSSGLTNNTLVVYCSDHGEMAGEHGCWWKSNYYEGSVGVPLILRLPGTLPRGKVCQRVCNLVDLGPTFLELSGAGRLPTMEGRSLIGIARADGDDEWTDETWSELVDVQGGDPNFPSRMVRSGRWKLWQYFDSEDLPPALFDLQSDPGETRDLGQSENHRAIREALQAKLLDGWDPNKVATAAHRKSSRYRYLTDWAKKVRPQSADSVPFPPPDYEDGVEIL